VYNEIGDDMFDRLELLIGDKINLIRDKHIAIIGIGGVGGYACEALVRSGIGKITIIDNDIIDITNLNRQIISIKSNIGKYKTDEWERRLKEINPDIVVNNLKLFLTKDNINVLNGIDYIIDACDTVETKKELILYSIKNNVKIISSMGTGNKMDPSKLKIMDIRKTSYDPLAKVIRKFVKDNHIKDNIMVVSSTEEQVRKIDKVIPSSVFVPGVCGLLLANYVINDIIKENYE